MPLTVQYLIGAGLAFSIAFIILLKNPRSSAYRYFSLYGLVIGFWMVVSFLHRNAPESGLSSTFVAFSYGFGLLGVSFLFATLLELQRRKPSNFLYLLPALGFSLYTVLSKPFDVVLTEFGWSYVPTNQLFSILYLLIGVLYMLGIIILGKSLIKNSETDMRRKRYELFLFGFIIFYVVCLSVSNYLLFLYPSFPPLGGIFITAIFLLVVYAIILPHEKIEVVRKISEEGNV